MTISKISQSSHVKKISNMLKKLHRSTIHIVCKSQISWISWFFKTTKCLNAKKSNYQRSESADQYHTKMKKIISNRIIWFVKNVFISTFVRNRVNATIIAFIKCAAIVRDINKANSRSGNAIDSRAFARLKIFTNLRMNSQSITATNIPHRNRIIEFINFEIINIIKSNFISKWKRIKAYFIQNNKQIKKYFVTISKWFFFSENHFN